MNDLQRFAERIQPWDLMTLAGQAADAELRLLFTFAATVAERDEDGER